jgi:hypothetical protein
LPASTWTGRRNPALGIGEPHGARLSALFRRQPGEVVKSA